LELILEIQLVRIRKLTNSFNTWKTSQEPYGTRAYELIDIIESLWDTAIFTIPKYGGERPEGPLTAKVSLRCLLTSGVSSIQSDGSATFTGSRSQTPIGADPEGLAMTANDNARITPATSSIIHILLYGKALSFLALPLLVRDLVKYRLPVILALLDASPFGHRRDPSRDFYRHGCQPPVFGNLAPFSGRKRRPHIGAPASSITIASGGQRSSPRFARTVRAWCRPPSSCAAMTIRDFFCVFRRCEWTVPARRPARTCRRSRSRGRGPHRARAPVHARAARPAKNAPMTACLIGEPIYYFDSSAWQMQIMK
jgi:hypothetical protein